MIPEPKPTHEEEGILWLLVAVCIGALVAGTYYLAAAVMHWLSNCLINIPMM